MRTINFPTDQPSLLEYQRILNELKHQGVHFIEPGKTYQTESGKVCFNHQLVFSDDTTCYVVGNEIGRGSYGSVHRLIHKITLGSTPEIFDLTSRPLVLKKQLLSPNKPIQGQISKITQEVDYLKRQQIHVHAQIQSSDTVHLIMDDCGQSMKSFMRDHANTTLRERLFFALSILNEVNFLQQNNIVHCDIKPANICVKEVKATKKTPKRHQFFLIDFGLSHDTDSLTGAEVGGSPAYIPPEGVYQDTNSTYQHATDLYALGGILGELFGCKHSALASFKYEAKKHSGLRGAVSMPYNFSTLLTDFDTNGFGELFKRDLLQLLLELSDPDPMKRPSLEVVIKFFLYTLSTLNDTQQGVDNTHSSGYLPVTGGLSYYEGVKAICAINMGDDGNNIQSESHLLSEVRPGNRSMESEINIILSLAGVNLALYNSSKLSEEVKQAILILDFNKLSIIDNWELLNKDALQRALIIAHQAEVNVKDNWELLNKDSFQRALIIAHQAEVNVKDNWELLNKDSFQRALIIAHQAEVNVKDNWELLNKDPFQRALIIANQAGVNVKDNWQLLKKESFQRALIIANQAGVNVKDNWQLLKKESFQRALIIANQAGVNLKDNWQLLKKESFQRALIIANQAGVNLKDNWQLLKKESFQRALIIANQAGVNVKDNWQLLKKESFQRALIIANQAGVNLKDNWQLLKKESFQRALIIANQAGVNLKDNWQLLKNEPLQSTISSASESIESIPTDRAVDKQFKSACLTLQKNLVKNVITSVGSCEQRGISFDYTKHYASQQIMKLDEIVQTVISTTDNDSEKIKALKNYENQAKKHSSGWVKFGKSIAGVLITGAGVVLGALAGAALGGAALSFTGPGAIVGAVLGAWKGASIGASVGGAITAGASCMFFRRKSKEEKLAKDIVQTGRETLRNRGAG